MAGDGDDGAASRAFSGRGGAVQLGNAGPDASPISSPTDGSAALHQHDQPQAANAGMSVPPGLEAEAARGGAQGAPGNTARPATTPLVNRGIFGSGIGRRLLFGVLVFS